jgi:hypothetical protein
MMVVGDKDGRMTVMAERQTHACERAHCIQEYISQHNVACNREEKGAQPAPEF